MKNLKIIYIANHSIYIPDYYYSKWFLLSRKFLQRSYQKFTKIKEINYRSYRTYNSISLKINIPSLVRDSLTTQDEFTIANLPLGLLTGCGVFSGVKSFQMFFRHPFGDFFFISDVCPVFTRDIFFFPEERHPTVLPAY